MSRILFYKVCSVFSERYVTLEALKHQFVTDADMKGNTQLALITVR